MVYYVRHELYPVVTNHCDCSLKQLKKRDTGFRETHNTVKRLIRLTIETGFVTGQGSEHVRANLTICPPLTREPFQLRFPLSRWPWPIFQVARRIIRLRFSFWQRCTPTRWSRRWIAEWKSCPIPNLARPLLGTSPWNKQNRNGGIVHMISHSAGRMSLLAGRV